MLFALEVIHSHSVSFFYNAEVIVNLMFQLWHPVVWSHKSRCYCDGILEHLSRASLVTEWQRFCLQCRSHRRCGFNPWVGKITQRRGWQPTPVFLLGESMDRGTSGLQFMGSQRTGHDWSNLAHMHATFKPVYFESSRLPSTMWVGLIQSVKGLRSKESFWKRNSAQDSNIETLPEVPACRSGLKVATSTCTWISNLLDCSTDFKLTTPYKSVSQDLRLNQSLTHAHSCSHSNLWFSFSAEPWLTEQVLPMCFCPVLSFWLRLWSSPISNCLTVIFTWSSYHHIKCSLSRLKPEQPFDISEHKWYLIKKNRHIC